MSEFYFKNSARSVGSHSLGSTTFYLTTFAQLYSDEVLESAIMGVLWGIATNPECYDKVTGNNRKHLASPEPILRFRAPVLQNLLWDTEQG